jgi:DNA-binding transcriptional MerR regulator
MQAYTLKEVAKKINVPPGTVRQWEKDLMGYIEIPRSKQGARIYTDTEINLLVEIKELQAKKINKDGIRAWLDLKFNPEVLPEPAEEENSLNVIIDPIVPVPVQETSMDRTEQFFELMDSYKQNFLREVREEIKSVVRKEMLDEVKKEISKGTLLTVKTVSDSIYKSSENTKADIQELTHLVEKNSEHATESMKYLSDSIASVSMETTEEIYNLSKQLSGVTRDLDKYVDVTNNEIYSLTEAIALDREYLIEEREQYRHEIRQREEAFQSMLNGFRDAAAAKERKWWKFWS